MDDSERMMRWLVSLCIDMYKQDKFFNVANCIAPITVAARSKAWVRNCLFLWLRVRIPPGHGCLSLVSILCCQVEVPATCRSLAQRIPTESGVPECYLEISTRRSLGPLGLASHEKKKKSYAAYNVKLLINNEVGRIWCPFLRQYYVCLHRLGKPRKKNLVMERQVLRIGISRDCRF